MDLHTFIMEPSISLHSHIFRHLQNVTYRDINLYNPLNITHPPSKVDYPHLDEVCYSAVGDDRAQSINLIVPQDCGGFNLGSFLIRRSEWSERLLDIWWDPVGYEQKHMEWEHKEQDALVSFLPPVHNVEKKEEKILTRSRSTSTPTSPGSAPALRSSRNA